MGEEVIVMKWMDAVLDLLFPPKCPFCHRLLAKGEVGFCAKCQAELPWALGKQGEQKPEFTAGCVSPLYYREGVRQAVHRFKFYGRAEYAKVFAPLMAQSVRDNWPEENFDLVTAVPLHWRRRRARGYDQAQLLAEEVGRLLGVPAQVTLKKIRHTPAQSGQSDHEARRVNVLGAYDVNGKEFAGERVLLVDDVVTSGATLSECARTLRTGGVKEVRAVTLARAGEEKKFGGNL